MEVGLALPHYDFSVPGENPLAWSTMVEVARRAEAAGFEALFLSDHLFLDVEKYGGGPGAYGAYEPLVTLAALARAVPRLRLGVLVFCEALRPAGTLAHALATLGRLTGGRLDVGLGAGWYEPEYAALGMDLPPPGARLARLREALAVVSGLLHDGPVTVIGKHHSVRDAVTRLPTVRPRVMLGGKGDRLLRLVAEGADGWNTVWAWEPSDYADRVRILEDACAAVGRDPSTAFRSLGLYTLVGEDSKDLERRYRRLQETAPGGMLAGVSLEEWRQGRLVGTVEEVSEQIETWCSLGVDQFVACVGALPFSICDLDDIELAGHAILGR